MNNTTTNNEVIPSIISDKTYTKDEVIDLLYKSPEGVSLKDFSNWIKDNL